MNDISLTARYRWYAVLYFKASSYC